MSNKANHKQQDEVPFTWIELALLSAAMYLVAYALFVVNKRDKLLATDVMFATQQYLSVDKLDEQVVHGIYTALVLFTASQINWAKRWRSVGRATVICYGMRATSVWLTTLPAPAHSDCSQKITAHIIFLFLKRTRLSVGLAGHPPPTVGDTWFEWVFPYSAFSVCGDYMPSGHMTMISILTLAMESKRRWGVLCCIISGLLLIFSRLHYTIDVGQCREQPN